MAAVEVSPELWSELDNELDALIEGTKTADESYTVGKGMSLASIAVGSAAMRLSKVRGMAQGRDLPGTKAALEKAALKVREAAFASSGDPEGVTLGKNLDILAALMDVLGRMEHPASGRDVKAASGVDARSRTAVAAATTKMRKDKGSNEGEQTETAQKEVSGVQGREGLFHDLGIVEPDDDPLSCLADEENGVGDGPRMRFLVEEVDPKLAEKERKLYWGGHGWGHTVEQHFSGSNMDCLAPTSLIGEGRQHVQVLQEALHQVSKPTIDDEGDMNEQPPRTSASTDKELATASPTSSFFKEGGKKATLKGADPQQEDQSNISPMKTEGNEGAQAAAGPDLDMAETLRKQIRQSSKDDYWPRLSLAYTLEEQGASFATAGKFSASSSAYAEASDLFQACSRIMPTEPETLLRQWVTTRRALEAGHTGGPPDVAVLRRCIKICNGSVGNKPKDATGDQRGPGSCNSPVCYEAHLELVAALLERGQFERCTKACRHILGKHDADDAEALYSLAQALVALGRFAEASECAKTADSLLAMTS